MLLSTQHGPIALPRCSAGSGSAPTHLGATPAAVVPGGLLARAFPVLAAANGSFTDFPPQHEPDDNESLVHTYGSFHEEPVSALSPNGGRGDAWTICIPVAVPDISSPTLLSVHYIIRYATTAEIGNSVIQTDVVLTTASLPAEVVSGGAKLDIYRPSAGIPRVVDQAAAVCLSNTMAVKTNGGDLHWSHYLDTQHVLPNVRVHEPAQLYLVFNVDEQPTCQTVRTFSAEVSATWQKEEVELEALAEEQRKAEEAALKAAQELEEKRKREADEQKARDEARLWMVQETRGREANAAAVIAAINQRAGEEQKARDEARQWMVKETQGREANVAAVIAAINHLAKRQSVAAAPPIADEKTQNAIVEAMTRQGKDLCTSGYPFEKWDDGYWCNGGKPGKKGSHFISFKDLGWE